MGDLLEAAALRRRANTTSKAYLFERWGQMVGVDMCSSRVGVFESFGVDSALAPRAAAGLGCGGRVSGARANLVTEGWARAAFAGHWNSVNLWRPATALGTLPDLNLHLQRSLP